ncbi:MAG TPA: flagellar hook-associated protein FlgL [Gemmatimonadaceae bacterium]|jgi:flagellar hook-associated protein 3 FlgL|nr:flagellar hook-associated protein FlgL [Gemmatimonadaceae bacterium]
MRITNSIIVQTQLAGLQTNMNAINTAQSEVSSGKKIQVASDDPTAASGIMTASSTLRAITQYQTNVSSATDRVNAEDSTLSQLTDLMTRAQEISVQEGSSTASSSTRAAAAQEAQGLLQSAIQLGNTKFGDEYLFGGDASTTAPFAMTGSGATASYTASGATGQRTVSIGDGETMVVSHTAGQVFVASGVLDSLVQLTSSLASGDVAGINAANTSIGTAFDNVQSSVGDVGARGDELQAASSALQTLQGNVASHQSDLQDVDVASAITDLTSRQTAYQAALVAISKTNTLSLTDYLTAS